LNTYTTHSLSPLFALRSLAKHWRLIYEMIKREVIGRYRGAMMGLLWSFFTPVLMLMVYTFVFSVIFKSRWVGGTGSRAEFAIVLFAGLMIFNLFSECINRAPSLVLSNPNYVKKVIFPLEILPVVAFGSALFHFFVSVLVWLLFYLIIFGLPSAQALWLPVVLLPLALLCIGLSWCLASLGVFLRDVGQVIGVITTVLMFMSPIFYSVESLPERFRRFMYISPITYFVEQTRDLLVWDKGMHWLPWFKVMLLSTVIASLGFAWFQKTRKGFADVI
jgi:lipopolysaccharide transport system permease protein